MLTLGPAYLTKVQMSVDIAEEAFYLPFENPVLFRCESIFSRPEHLSQFSDETIKF